MAAFRARSALALAQELAVVELPRHELAARRLAMRELGEELAVAAPAFFQRSAWRAEFGDSG